VNAGDSNMPGALVKKAAKKVRAVSSLLSKPDQRASGSTSRRAGRRPPSPAPTTRRKGIRPRTPSPPPADEEKDEEEEEEEEDEDGKEYDAEFDDDKTGQGKYEEEQYAQEQYEEEEEHAPAQSRTEEANQEIKGTKGITNRRSISFSVCKQRQYSAQITKIV
jgi:hypothetical protein